jgi:hypothetical protein
MERATISSDEFKRRLPQLCLTARTAELPRRQRDRHILLKALSLSFEARRFYTELEVNRIIEGWLNQVGRSLEIDHVTLRRTLIDEGYLTRAPEGVAYQVGRPHDVGFFFSEDVATIDTETVIREAIAEIARRRDLYQKT